jgi:hypothetical protein
MVLIKENITEAIAMLKDLLMRCVENETVVCIHGKINEFTVRYSSTLDEYNIDYNEICLVCGWFEVYNKSIITEIDYDEEENSVHIVFEGGELYIDSNNLKSENEY